MKHLVIIGARGYGREVFELAQKTIEYQKGEYDIKGFLDGNCNAFDGVYGAYPPILSSVESYEIQSDDVFICALGDSTYRKKYSDIILAKGGNFISLINPSTEINPTTRIGKGCIINSKTVIGGNTVIGDFVTIQSFDVIGHDVTVGDYVSIECFVFLGGFTSVGNMTTLHTRSTVIPHKKVGNNVTVGVGSFVMRNFKDNVTVFGYPAKVVDL